jgi:hypothetical protein
MNAPILIVNGLMFLTLIGHTFLGDKDMKVIEPEGSDVNKIEKWVMARGAFHLVGIDVLMATIGLTLINFTNVFIEVQSLLVKILAFYYLLYAISFFIVIMISKQFPKNYWILWQWLFFILISVLLFLGAK